VGAKCINSQLRQRQRSPRSLRLYLATANTATGGWVLLGTHNFTQAGAGQGGQKVTLT